MVNLGHPISIDDPLRIDLAVYALAVVHGKIEHREDAADCCEVARAFTGTARHMLVEPLFREFAGRDQLQVRLFPFTDRNAFLVRFLGVAMIRAVIDQGRLAVSSAPTFHHEFIRRLRFRDDRSRR